MPVTLAQLQALLENEYANLVARFNLSPLPLDLYEIDDSGNGGLTAHGTDKRNDTPGYTPTRIVLPQAAGDLSAWSAVQHAFPPAKFDRHNDEWPAWRTDLWHEVVHQYQHQVLKNWDPKDGDGGHAKGWPDAVRDFATSFGITPQEQLGVL